MAATALLAPPSENLYLVVEGPFYDRAVRVDSLYVDEAQALKRVRTLSKGYLIVRPYPAQSAQRLGIVYHQYTNEPEDQNVVKVIGITFEQFEEKYANTALQFGHFYRPLRKEDYVHLVS